MIFLDTVVKPWYDILII
ncbi:palindromic element RPE4 domain-containing protein [Rickettsia sp. R2]|uniref:Palindromic element RPE4 domain-containing protein n=1 Tax=Rickettsia japonica TaxID=35790 RepID=A0ABM6YH36_RICJA|nr:palindromic element RPE4 domain-containing protein [Rickettsia japonica]QHE25533.1 palindromic element RPE4 domain-containing protein [Rickettsia japonica]